MSFGPACERCGCNSYEGSQDGPARCPFCGKHKRRGSREEIIEVLAEARHCILTQAGFQAGQSIASEQQVRELVRETLKRIEDV